MFNDYKHIKIGLSNSFNLKAKMRKLKKSRPESPTLSNWDFNSIKQITNSNQKTDNESNIQKN